MRDHHPSFVERKWKTDNDHKLDHFDFRLSLSRQIFRKYPGVEKIGNAVDLATGVATRLNGNHYNFGTTKTATEKIAKGDCRCCKRNISWKCLDCDVFLCRDVCYEVFHTKTVFKS
jgi:hypothetical protein